MNFEAMRSKDSRRLKIPFSEEEISAALSNLCREKASRPNGFTIAFSQLCWDCREQGDFFKELVSFIEDLVPP
ncbi:hypothetical protein CK203_026776 [Vitis vinifera]|uniref:Uncharacterized protein n=1 Tax=Vitis vinifera TaxID=29760 RepID=A0A438IP85_VITVI|nr:hypothetical protein CK203_026776 [Vitis vinifera]